MMRMFPVRTMEAMRSTLAIRTSVLMVMVLCSIHLCLPDSIRYDFWSVSLVPLPLTDFRQVFAVFINVMLVLDELVPHHLLQIRPLGTQMR